MQLRNGRSTVTLLLLDDTAGAPKTPDFANLPAVGNFVNMTSQSRSGDMQKGNMPVRFGRAGPR